MKKIRLILPLLFTSLLLISACATIPNSLQLTPKIDDSVIITKVDQHYSWLLSSQDLRSARYLISISSGNDVATLINETSSTRKIVEKTLQTHWIKEGHTFTNNNNNPYKITVQVLKLLAEVEQNRLTHNSDINVVLKVEVQSDKSIFSKTFRTHYAEEAPLKANVKTLSKQLNSQLSQLLDQIVQDTELKDKLLLL